VIGLGIVLLALGLALPLPIPGSNLIFLVPLFVYALGVLERDGLWIALGHLGTLANMVLLVVLGAKVVAASTDPLDKAKEVAAGLPFPVYITTDPSNLLAEALTAAGKEPQVEFCPP